jgi:hypothetical protein
MVGLFVFYFRLITMCFPKGLSLFASGRPTLDVILCDQHWVMSLKFSFARCTGVSVKKCIAMRPTVSLGIKFGFLFLGPVKWCASATRYVGCWWEGFQLLDKLGIGGHCLIELFRE